MKRGSTIFLQTVIVLIGIGALTFLLWEPHVEGRNVNATVFAIYFKDPFLAYAYFSSIPFFMGLCQAFKLLGSIGRNELFSQRSVRSLRIVKHCGMATVGFIIGGLIWITLAGTDDRPPAVVMGGVASFISIVVATAAAVCERLLQSAVDMKSENDLTV